MSHRRARHLNPNAAGATLVLDSRFIAGADGDAIGTWSDRSGAGNNATQATVARKPLLKLTTNGIAGNPVLLFDGDISDGDRLATVTIFSAQPFTVFIVGSLISGIGRILSGSGNNWLLGTHGGFSNRYFGTSAWVYQGTTSSTASIIHCGDAGSNSCSYYRNGVSLATGKTATGSPSGFIIGAGGAGAGGAGNEPANCKIACVLAFPSLLSASLRKRITNSTARVWKISCR